MKIVLIVGLWILAMFSISIAVEIEMIAAWKYINKKEDKEND